VTNLSRLRASARAAKLGPEDKAALQFAEQLAALLDRATDLTPARVLDGERPMSQVVKIVGPQYGRLLTSLGLTRAGRGAVPAAAIPTAGSPAGASAEAKAHDAHRQRFRDRAGG
jgi:hypothetical protein